MCGIAGFFGFPSASNALRSALVAMAGRGLDGAGIATAKGLFFAHGPSSLIAPESGNALGHLLHSVVGSVKQPLKGRGLLSANCEIYNWKELAEKHGLRAGNDAELLLGLLDRLGVKKTIALLDGVWAFAYWRGSRVFLSRDLLGEKPLWYSLEKPLCPEKVSRAGSGGRKAGACNVLCFASELKALEAAGCGNAMELDPKQLLVFDIKRGKARFEEGKFLQLEKSTLSFEDSVERLGSLLGAAVKKRVPEREFGLLFSGGVDSVLLALVFKRLGLKFRCFFSFVQGIGEPKDLAFAKRAAGALGLELELVPVSEGDVRSLLPGLVSLIESANPIKVCVALPLFLACRAARRHGLKVIFSGLGADELFCGYSRFRLSNNAALDSLDLLLQMHENDLYRDDVLAMNNGLELRLPFLDLALAEFALSLPQGFKISGGRNKIALRELALSLGLPEELAERKKTAAQYGSNFDKAVERLAKKAGARGKAAYLSSFSKKGNMPIAALFSGGKDSCLSLWLMQRQNYDVKCLVSIVPKNRDSFMYHKPDREFLKLQSEALGIPLVVGETPGEKEKELAALKKALLRAKKEFGICGVVSGALYSNYQRERIQRICNSFGLRLFSPLWHKNQLEELRELERNGFVFAMSKIAALGLSGEWLGKPIGAKEIAALGALEKRFGINVAGEGGEYESLVLDAPNFSKKIRIVQSEKKMRNEFTGFLKIKKSVLGEKQGLA